MSRTYFDYLVEIFPNDWNQARFEMLPQDSDGNLYSSWKEVYENYMTYLRSQEIPVPKQSRFEETPSDIFDLSVLYIPLEKISDLFDKICRFDSELCSSTKNFWVLLWKRDINDQPPLDVKEKYLEFVSEYNNDDSIRYKLYTAIRFGALRLIPSLIEQEPDILNEDEKPLHLAVENGFLDIVKYLVSLGANISVFDRYHQMHGVETILAAAAANDHLDIVKYLIEQGADFSINDYEAVYVSARNNILKFFIEEKNIRILSVLNESLKYAAASGNLDNVKYLIDKGADFTYDDYCPLLEAILHNHLNVVKFFIEEKGIDIANNDYEFFYRSTRNINLSILKYFIEEKGIRNLILLNKALLQAILEGQLDVIKYLIEEGSGANITYDNYRPLNTAVISGYLDVIKYLIEEKGFDVSFINDDAFWKSIQFHRLRMIEYIVEKKYAGNLKIINEALVLASTYGFEYIVKYLLEQGGDIAYDNYLSFRKAILSNNLHFVRYLVEEKRLDVNLMDNSLFRQLFEKNQTEMISYLLSKGFVTRKLDPDIRGRLKFIR